MEYSIEIANLLISFLEEMEINYDFIREKGIIKFSINVDGKVKRFTYFIQIKKSSYIVYITIAVAADKDCMGSVAEYLTRANYGLQYGSFELDWNDGEIRYRHLVDCENCPPSQEVIRNSILIPYSTFERYGDGLLSVIFGAATAKEAVAKAEA